MQAQMRSRAIGRAPALAGLLAAAGLSQVAAGDINFPDFSSTQGLSLVGSAARSSTTMLLAPLAEAKVNVVANVAAVVAVNRRVSRLIRIRTNRVTRMASARNARRRVTARAKAMAAVTARADRINSAIHRAVSAARIGIEQFSTDS